MSEEFEIPVNYFIHNHNHTTRDISPDDCAKCLINKLKAQLKDANEVIREYESNVDYYKSELAGSWLDIGKEYKDKYKTR